MAIINTGNGRAHKFLLILLSCCLAFLVSSCLNLDEYLVSNDPESSPFGTWYHFGKIPNPAKVGTACNIWVQSIDGKPIPDYYTKRYTSDGLTKMNQGLVWAIPEGHHVFEINVYYDISLKERRDTAWIARYYRGIKVSFDFKSGHFYKMYFYVDPEIVKEFHKANMNIPKGTLIKRTIFLKTLLERSFHPSSEIRQPRSCSTTSFFRQSFFL